MATASSALIAPFWTRVPRFFFFPANPAALWRVLIFALLPALGAFAGGLPGILVASVGLSLLAWIFLLRFGSRVLSETSLGHLSPVDYSPLPDETLAHMPFKIFGLFMISGLCVGVVAGLFGETMGWLANFAVTVVTPAALMVLIISRSLATGLNPAAGMSVISSIGKPYVLLCIFLFFLSSGQMFLIGQVVQHAVAPIMAKWAALQESLQQLAAQQDEDAMNALMQGFATEMENLRPRFASYLWVINAVAMYFTLIAFNMMGYVLYQFHAELGLEVDVLPGQRRKSSAKTVLDSESEQIASLIAEGKIDQALDMAYEAQRLEPENSTLQERYHKLLHLAGKDERLLNHSQKFIPLMLRLGQGRNAVEAWVRCRERQDEYRLEDPAQTLKLAEAARAIREPKRAMQIINRFDQLHRNHPLVADMYFLGGSILCEDLHKDELADRFFVTLIKRYPAHPRVEDALRLRDIIRRMKKSAEPSAASA